MQISRLNSYHRDMTDLFRELDKCELIDLSGELAKQLNILNNKIINVYSEDKLNNDQYTNLKTEVSILYEEIYKKKIKSLISMNSNGMLFG